jgi:outer membrane cobalamin receptor
MNKYLLVLLMLPLSLNMMAQHKITGHVLDAKTKQAVENVNILLKPMRIGTISNEKGHFVFEDISSGDYELKFSMVGYKVRVVKVKLKERDSLLQVTMIEENQDIGEVSVVGETTEQKKMSSPASEPVSLDLTQTSISRADLIQKGAVSLVDGMKFTTGGLVETRGRKVKQFFSVRGQTYPYPSYAVDGVWLKEFQETAYFLNAANIEEIQIVRSGSALLKSLSPLSGVIDVTRRKYTNQETNLMLKYGTDNTYQTAITHGNKTEKLHYSGGVQLFGTNGPENRNGKEKIVNADANFDWQINKKLEASFKLFYLGGSRQLIQPVEPADSKFMNRREIYDPLKTFMLSSKLKYKTNDRLSSELQVNFAHRNPEYKNENISKGTVTTYNETDYEWTVNQLNALKLSSTNVLRVGALYNHWVAPKGKRYFYGKKADVHTLSGVIADQQRMGKWLFDTGFRFTQEYYKEWGGFSLEGSGGKFKTVSPVKNEWQSPVWQANLGFTYSINSLFSWHTNMAQGIVTPRKGALNQNGEKPKSEKRTNLDIGFVKKWKNNEWIKLTGFMVNRKEAIGLSGAILEVNEGEIIELYNNTDKRNYGLELDVQMPLVGSWITSSFNASLMKGETMQGGNWKRDDEIPEFIVNMAFHLKKSDFDFNVFANYTGEYKNDRFVSKNYIQEFGKAPLGDFYLVDLLAGYTLKNKYNIRFFGEMKNALNKAFQTVAGYPDKGRMISVGADIRL